MSTGKKSDNQTRPELCEPLVLVAKDDMIGRKLTCDLLKGKGYRVLEVKNSKRIIEATLQNQPDLVLIDFKTKSSSLEMMMKNIKNDQRLSRIPFLTLSHPGKDLTIINDFKQDVDVALKKPASSVSIVEKIESILAKLRKYASR